MELFSDRKHLYQICGSMSLVSLSAFSMCVCSFLLSQQIKAGNGVRAGLSSSDHSSAIKGHASTRPVNHPSNTTAPSRPHPHTFYRQVQLHLPFFELIQLFSRHHANLRKLMLVFFLSSPPLLSPTTDEWDHIAIDCDGQHRRAFGQSPPPAV